MNASREDQSGTPNREDDEGEDVVKDQPTDRRDGNQSDQSGRGKVRYATCKIHTLSAPVTTISVSIVSFFLFCHPLSFVSLAFIYRAL